MDCVDYLQYLQWQACDEASFSSLSTGAPSDGCWWCNPPERTPVCKSAASPTTADPRARPSLGSRSSGSFRDRRRAVHLSGIRGENCFHTQCDCWPDGETHHAFCEMTVLKLLLFRFGFAVSSSLVAVVAASVARARMSALPLDKRVQRDPSEVVLVHALHLEAFNLIKTEMNINEKDCFCFLTLHVGVPWIARRPVLISHN